MRSKFKFRNVILLIFAFFLSVFFMEVVFVWRSLSAAEDLFLSKDSSNSVVIYRTVDKKRIAITFNRETDFFIFTENDNNPRIGYYWDCISVLESGLSIPFVGSNFEIISKEMHQEDSLSTREAVSFMECLPSYPLFFYDKVAMVAHIALNKCMGQIP